MSPAGRTLINRRRAGPTSWMKPVWRLQFSAFINFNQRHAVQYLTACRTARVIVANTDANTPIHPFSLSGYQQESRNSVLESSYPAHSRLQRLSTSSLVHHRPLFLVPILTVLASRCSRATHIVTHVPKVRRLLQYGVVTYELLTQY